MLQPCQSLLPLYGRIILHRGDRAHSPTVLTWWATGRFHCCEHACRTYGEHFTHIFAVFRNPLGSLIFPVRNSEVSCPQGTGQLWNQCLAGNLCSEPVPHHLTQLQSRRAPQPQTGRCQPEGSPGARPCLNCDRCDATAPAPSCPDPRKRRAIWASWSTCPQMRAGAAQVSGRLHQEATAPTFSK